MENILRRTIHPVTRIVDAAKGIVDYVASDETLDSFQEVIRASGWRFTNFQKNAPFVDSHDYQTIEKQLGKVIDFGVTGKRLVERVQWAIDVPENKLANLGWRMTEAGYLKAVSVGFTPVKFLTRLDASDVNHVAEWNQQLEQLGLNQDSGVRTIYVEQEQVELSAVVIGANPNALAKCYKAGVLSDSDIDFFAALHGRNTSPLVTGHPSGFRHESPAAAPADAKAKLMAVADALARERFIDDLRERLARI